MIKKRAAEGNARRYRSHQYLHDEPFISSGKNRIKFNFSKYPTYAEIINFLNLLAKNFPDRVRVQSIGTTHEGRQIPLIKVNNFFKILIKFNNKTKKINNKYFFF